MNVKFSIFSCFRYFIFIILLVVPISCKKEAPTVVTLAVTEITAESAKCGGNVTDEGGGSVVSKGVIWGNTDPTLELYTGLVTIGTGPGIFNCPIHGLDANTEYIVRAFASNEYGTSYGDSRNFRTIAKYPTVVTTAPYEVTGNSAKAGGVVSDDGGSEVIERGIYLGKNIYPENGGIKLASGSGTGSFTVDITGLEAFCTYYVKAYAINAVGVSIGEHSGFKTSHSMTSGTIDYNPAFSYGTLTDIDGNIYKTIVIGTQTWMADNLRTTRYNDGRKITNIPYNTVWIATTTPAYCWYQNEINYKDYTGALYNWHVLDSGNVCPSGWHIPSDSEWKILTDYLGGELVAGGKIKEAGLKHWDPPNEGATNSSGFTSLPGGQRLDSDGTFVGLTYYDTWWTSTEVNYLKPYYRNDAWSNTQVYRGGGGLKTMGRGIRCLKD